MFLSMIGGPTYDILWSLASPGLPEGKSYAEIVALLKSHYEPKPIIIAERWKFHKHNQLPGESIADFVAKMRCLTAP